MDRQEIIQDLINKTFLELSKPVQPTAQSRTWKDPEGFKYLVQWSNAVLLRYLIRMLTSSLPKSEYRRKAQLDDCARSVVRNIEEGWKRANTADYLNFLGYSQGSLEETKGDLRELTEDRFLPSKPGMSLANMGLNLGDFNKALAPIKSSNNPLEDNKGKIKDFSYKPITVLYPPLSKVKAADLTFEIFNELTNKTDYLLRTLVQSLEKKLNQDRKGYQIVQARIRDKFKK